MKKIIFEKYKTTNCLLVLLTGLLLLFMQSSHDSWFKGPEALDYYKYFYAIYDPIYSGGRWFVVILAVLLLFPSKIFRNWLFFVAPPILLFTFILVSNISVYSNNILNPTRAKMAENGMFVLAVATAILIVVHFGLRWLKSRRNNL